MLNCKLSPRTWPSVTYLRRPPRWQSGAARHLYRIDLGIATSQYLRIQTGLSGAASLLGGGSRGLAVLLLAMLTGCTTRGPYQTTPLEVSEDCTMPAAEAVLTTPSDESWWRQLNHPAINVPLHAAKADSPSIAQAIPKVYEARALLGATSAQRMPSVDVDGYATRAHSLDTDSSTSSTILSTQSGIGPGLSWEIDLFGRVRNSVEVDVLRTHARGAYAKAARLALTSQIGNLVLTLRAFELSIAVLHEEIDSREKTLALTRRRLDTGFVAPIEETRAQIGLASARTTLARCQEARACKINALVAVTGQPHGPVQAVFAVDTQAVSLAQLVTAISPAPIVQQALPATILAAHPAVAAAEREAGAAWSEIAVSRAEHLPRLDPAAALSGQCPRAAGQSLSETVWPLVPTLGAPVFDGGRGAANVSVAQARHRAADAILRLVVRAAAQALENAMAAIESATARRRSTLDAVNAAQRVLAATQAHWNVGAVTLPEVEDVHHQLADARDSAIAAANDSNRAWIALVRASGHASAATPGGRLS